MYEHYLKSTPAGVTDLAFTVDEESIQADDLSPDPATVSVTVSIAVTTDQRGTITIFGDGTLTSSMGGLGVTTDNLESYFRTGIRLLEALVPNTPYYCSTSQEFLNTDDLTELTDDHVVILSSAVNPDHTRMMPPDLG